MALGDVRHTTMTRGGWLAPLAAAAAAVALLCLAACARQTPLVVVAHPWVGYETLYLARDLKWLPETIELKESQGVADSLAALKSGAAGAACMTLDEMLRARSEGIPLSAALVFDVSAGADMVLARPEIKTLGDLANKRIAYDRSALGALVFERLLEAARLPASAVIQVDLPSDQQMEAWRQNKVDAVITYEPLSNAFLHAGAHSIFDSRQMPDTIIDVLAVRRDRPELLPQVRTLVASHFRALEHMRTGEQDSLYRIAARQGIDPAEARRMLSGIAVPSVAANRIYLWGADSRLRLAAEKLSAAMVRRGIIKHDDGLNDLILPGTLPDQER